MCNTIGITKQNNTKQKTYYDPPSIGSEVRPGNRTATTSYHDAENVYTEENPKIIHIKYYITLSKLYCTCYIYCSHKEHLCVYKTSELDSGRLYMI